MFTTVTTLTLTTAKPASWTPGRHNLAIVSLCGADLALAKERVR